MKRNASEQEKYPKGTEVVARDYQVVKQSSLEGKVGTVMAADDGDYAVLWPGLGVWMHRASHLMLAKNAKYKVAGRNGGRGRPKAA